MKRWVPLALLLVVGVMFLILNRAAYKGYFQDDEFDNIVNTRDIQAREWISWFLTPRLSKDNFRPAGHLYFFALNRLARLDFAKYVAVVHVLHLLNTLLLFFLLRRLGLNPFAAVAGAAFFALGVSAFDAYWKPMYVFDVLCTTFSLATLLLYVRGHWIAAVMMMWFAYKSKELAVMLPLVLLAHEYWFGSRRWMRLAPFFLISACFGAQAILSPQPKGNPYAFVFTLAALGQTLTFYSSRIFLLPFAGLALVVIPIAIRDRRIFLGAAILTLFFAPLLFLPGRMYPAYTYLPLTGAAIEVAALADMVPPAATLAFFAIWIPWNIAELRVDRRATLTADDEVRIYAGALLDFARLHPDPPAVVFSSAPATFHQWGIQAALNYPYRNSPISPKFMDEGQARNLSGDTRVTFISWDRDHNKVRMLSKDPAVPDASYLKMGPDMPVWQLDKGWQGLDDYFRWTEARAIAHLTWPANANQFEVVINVSPSIIRTNGYTEVRLKINGQDLGVRRFDRPGIEALRWDLPLRQGVQANIELNMEPVSHFPPDPRLLGAPVVALGFVTGENGP
jgi:hypothetical protein